MGHRAPKTITVGTNSTIMGIGRSAATPTYNLDGQARTFETVRVLLLCIEGGGRNEKVAFHLWFPGLMDLGK